MALGRRLYWFSLSRPYQTLLLAVAGCCLCQNGLLFALLQFLLLGLLPSGLG